MRIAYFSPLPPQHSGIADYSAELLPYLACQAEIDLFIGDGYRPTAAISQQFAVHSYRKFSQMASDYDVYLYHMGNDAFFHEYIYQTLLEYPGIVVCHEYVLQHFIQGITLQRGDRQRYVAEMRYGYGQTGARLAHLLLETNQGVDPYTHPLFERAVDASLGVIVHNECTKQRILESRPLARVGKTPHMYFGAQTSAAPDVCRDRLGLSQENFIIGSFGVIASPKRLETSLRAFARFRYAFPDAIYVLVGEVLPSSNVRSLIQDLELQHNVIITGYVDMETFLQYMGAVDLALNLRFPTGGETSGSLIRLMNMSKPVIVSNSGSFAEYPDDCCVKIDVDELEEETLLVMMHVLASDEALRRQIGTNARRHIQTHHSMEKTVQGYIDFIQDVSSSPPQPFAVVPPLVEPDEDDIRTGLIADVSAELTDLGIGETDEDVLQEIARTINELVPG